MRTATSVFNMLLRRLETWDRHFEKVQFILHIFLNMPEEANLEVPQIALADRLRESARKFNDLANKIENKVVAGPKI